MNKCAVAIALALSLLAPGFWHYVNAKSLKPIKDVATENEVIKLYNQALRYSKGERNVHARVVLEQAAKYDPTSVSPYIHAALSEIYHDLGNPDKAIQEGLAALRYDPTMKDMYYNLGLFCKDANRYNEGIQYLNKFVEMSSGDKRTNALALIESLTKEQQKMGAFSNNDPDYLGQLMAEGQAHYWPATKIPLKVFIDQTSSARGFKPEFVGIAHDAFITWYQASGKKLSFAFVNTLDEADINVEWTDGMLKVGDEKYERTKAGLTTTTRREHTIERARIQIRTVQAFTKNPEPVDRIKETCLHEIGHALGLNGHSTSTADIMYFGNSTRQLPALTKRDKATMARLYSSYPPFPMIGVDSSFPYPAPVTNIPQLTGDDGSNYGGGYGNTSGGYNANGAGGYDANNGGASGAGGNYNGGAYGAASNYSNSSGGGFGNTSDSGTSGVGSANASDSGTSSGSPDELLSIPADEIEAATDPGTPLPPTPQQAEAEQSGSQTSPVSAATSQLPGWSPPGAASGMPVQSWQTPAGNAPPYGVAWPQQPQSQPIQQPVTPYSQTGYGPPSYGSQSYPVQQTAMPYATTPAQYAAPTGQTWPQAQLQYSQQNNFAGNQPVVQSGYQQNMNAPVTMQSPGAGPEQSTAGGQQNPVMQFAQQFMPQNGQQAAQGPNPIMQFAQQVFQGNQNGQPGAPQRTPGQMVDQVLQMFNPQQQQQQQQQR